MKSVNSVNSANSIIVIPARYGSSRFPGKPLALIKGVSLLERTWRIARSASPDRVLIATDDDRIEEAATRFGAEVVRTSEHCSNGTERVYEAVERSNIGTASNAGNVCLGGPSSGSHHIEDDDIIINLQGDAVLTPPWILKDIIDAMKANPSVRIATPATKLTMPQYNDLVEQKKKGIVGGTLVVFDKNLNALYFSKAPIPFVRSTPSDVDLPLYRHVGLYAYRYSALKEYLTLPPSPLEQLEGLEQLRALENGLSIRIVVVDYKGRTHWSVDSPEDVERVEQIIVSQGELAPDFPRAARGSLLQ